MPDGMFSDFYSFISAAADVALPVGVAGLLTGLSGFMITLLNEKRRKVYAENETIENIVKSVREVNDKAKIQVIQSVADRIDGSVSKKEISDIIEGGVRIGGDLIISNQNNSDVKLVEDLVTNYHNQALSQAKVQFLFSVFAATVGFIYILYAAAHIDDANMATVAKILPGVVVDAIAALFFKQAEQTRQRATELYDRLRKDQHSQRAENIVNSIEDISVRSAVKAQIALHMVGLSPKEIDIQTFVSNVGKGERI